jgi:hypothetical protein
MKVTFSFLFLLTVIIVVMLRFRHRGDGLTVFEFLLCGAWGFLLASSSFEPTIRNVLTSLVRAISR